MKSYITLLWLLVLAALATASSSNDQQLEILELPAKESTPALTVDVGPRESRHGSLTRFKAPPAILNPETLLVPSLKSPTSITAEELSEEPVAVVSGSAKKPEKRILHNYKSFASLPVVTLRTIKVAEFTSPRSSPIISQLNVLDQLMASANFPLATEPKPLMAGHLSVLRAHCRHLASTYGPLNPKSINCAFRYHELVRFIQLLTKYDTTYESHSIKRNLPFCSVLVTNLKRLQTLVNSVLLEHSHRINKSSSSTSSTSSHSLNPELYALLEPHANELRDLDRAIDVVDLDILFYCESKTFSHESFFDARGIISNFLDVAFM